MEFGHIGCECVHIIILYNGSGCIFIINGLSDFFDPDWFPTVSRAINAFSAIAYKMLSFIVNPVTLFSVIRPFD